VSFGIILFAHGSRLEPANEEVRTAARELAAAGGYAQVEPAFLELGRPDLAGAVERLTARGVSQVLIIPYFLTAGRHQDRDLPALVERLAPLHPGVEIRIGAGLAGHPGVTRILLDRVRDSFPGAE
jgi:sirohydrochlorin ferrochelatase